MWDTHCTQGLGDTGASRRLGGHTVYSQRLRHGRLACQGGGGHTLHFQGLEYTGASRSQRHSTEYRESHTPSAQPGAQTSVTEESDSPWLLIPESRVASEADSPTGRRGAGAGGIHCIPGRLGFRTLRRIPDTHTTRAPQRLTYSAIGEQTQGHVFMLGRGKKKKVKERVGDIAKRLRNGVPGQAVYGHAVLCMGEGDGSE